MTGEVIKSFLVGLGFEVEDGSLEKFNKAIATAGIRVAALYASIQIAAAGILKGVAGIAEGFEKFGYEARLIAPAINKTLELRHAMLEAYSRAGIDIIKVVKQSVIFNLSLAKTKFALEALYKSVGAKFIPVLTKQLDIFRSKIYGNMPKIQAALEKMVKFLLKAFEATVHLGATLFSILGRVWDFFAKLDEATGGWSTKIFLAIAAWKLLNLAFLASPLGLILTGLLAILALYDDFKTFQEGGQSLFDWSKAIPIINQVKAIIVTLVTAVTDLFNAFKKLFAGDFRGFFDSLLGYANKLFSVFSGLQGIVEGLVTSLAKGAVSKIAGFFGSSDKDKPQNQEGSAGQGIAKGITNMFGGSGAAPALAGATQPAPMIGPQNNTNQHVSQQTNINVQGSPDANATAKSVSNEQSKVNFDMTRNLKGATR